MDSITQVTEALQVVLTTQADEIARATGFVQRASKLTGSKFVQTLVLTWLADPAATYEQLAQSATALEVPITAQGIEQRFTPQAAERVLQNYPCGVAAAHVSRCRFFVRLCGTGDEPPSSLTCIHFAPSARAIAPWALPF